MGLYTAARAFCQFNPGSKQCYRQKLHGTTIVTPEALTQGRQAPGGRAVDGTQAWLAQYQPPCWLLSAPRVDSKRAAPQLVAPRSPFIAASWHRCPPLTERGLPRRCRLAAWLRYPQRQGTGRQTHQSRRLRLQRGSGAGSQQQAPAACWTCEDVGSKHTLLPACPDFRGQAAHYAGRQGPVACAHTHTHKEDAHPTRPRLQRCRPGTRCLRHRSATTAD